MANLTVSESVGSWIQIAAIDCNGVLRAKRIRTAAVTGDKLEKPFGFASPLFGMDGGSDLVFDPRVMDLFPGYGDVLVQVDPATRRNVPWQDDVPLYLLNMNSVESANNAIFCARSLLQATAKRLSSEFEMTAQAGYEAEFHMLPLTTAGTTETRGFGQNVNTSLSPLLPTSAPYSIQNMDSVDAFTTEFCQAAEKMGCPLYSFHFEGGPSLVEASILHSDIMTSADNTALIQFVASGIGKKHGIRTSFMAKPYDARTGASGHIHPLRLQALMRPVSLYDKSDNNLLIAQKPRADEEHPDSKQLSETGVHFLAGMLECLPDITLMLCPNINSYKRLIGCPWGQTASWGLNSRVAAIRIIAPPYCAPKDTRFEIRVPGSDTAVHYAFSTLLSAGMQGIRTKTKLSTPAGKPGPRLPHSLHEALVKFRAEDSLARKLLDAKFIDWYGVLKEVECKAYEKAVTDWEVKRYL